MTRSPFDFSPINLPKIDSIRIPSAAETARAQYLGNNFAGDILKKIVAQVRSFEAALSDEEEVAISIVTNSGLEQISVERVEVLPPETLVLSGFDVQGNRVAMIQHATQANILLRATTKRTETARRIGFEIHSS